jgi:hypothetical protein
MFALLFVFFTFMEMPSYPWGGEKNQMHMNLQFHLDVCFAYMPYYGWATYCGWAKKQISSLLFCFCMTLNIHMLS